MGCVVIHHDGLQDPLVAPLQPFSCLNVDVVMRQIEKVLNGLQELVVNESFEITTGTINLPKCRTHIGNCRTTPCSRTGRYLPVV